MPRPKKTAAVAAPLDVANSPEFKAALEAGIAQATQSIMERVMQLRAAEAQAAAGEPASGGMGNASDVEKFARGIAMAMADLGSQGVGKQAPLDPAIVAARAKAREKMIDLIVTAKERGEVPTYGLTAKVHLADQLLEPIYIDPTTKRQRQTEIDYFGVPNHAMQPLNQTARDISEQFNLSVGSNIMTPNDDMRLLSVTAKGTVIRGASHAMRQLDPQASHTGVDSQVSTDLRVRRGESTENFSETRVLGTLMPAAKSVGGRARAAA